MIVPNSHARYHVFAHAVTLKPPRMFQRYQPMQQLDIQRDGDHPTAAACAYHGVDWSCPQLPLPIASRPSSVIRAPREQQARAFWDPRFVFWEYAICRGVRLFFSRSDEAEVCVRRPAWQIFCTPSRLLGKPRKYVSQCDRDGSAR